MSDGGNGALRRHSFSTPVARLSLLLGVMTCVAGCFDAPPEYSVPERIPPAIVSAGVVPALSKLLISPGPTILFTAPFRADDFGQRLRAPMVLDIASGRPDAIDEAALTEDPRPFNEQDRTATYPWTWTGKTDPGCHTMTLIISDSDNIENLYITTDPRKEARVTWFLWLQDMGAGSAEVDLPKGCFLPTSAGVAQ